MTARAATAIVLVAATYLAALASLDPVDVATAFVVATVLVLGFRRFLLVGRGKGPSVASRVLAFPLFAAEVIRAVTVGTWEVALIVLHVRPLRCPGIVAIPFEERTPAGVAVTALVATLSPGELLVEIDRERKVMLMHVIDASDPDETRRRYREFYDRFQRRVFP